jgi:D-alanyl-lipoteichoic acid acyltransferase DltB (MBOAT superfamily)
VTDVVAQDRKLPNLKELWQMSTTFAFVTFAWIFFRADGMNIALGYIKQIGDSIIEHPGQFLMLPAGKMAFVYIIPLIVGDWYLRRDERKLRTISSVLNYIIYLFLAHLIFINFSRDTNFIYFQF